MKKLKIAILDFDDIKNPLLGAGQAKATLEVGKRLAEKGHEITVITSRFPGYEDRWENGIYYRHIGVGTKNIKLNNLIYILALPFEVMRLKADLILECFTAPISTLFTPLFTKIPVVAKPTSFEAERFSKIYHLPFEVIERTGSKLYKFFLASNPVQQEKMKKYNPKINSLIVVEGVEESYFNFKRKKPKHILYIGRFDINQKGLDLLLAAFAKVAKKIRYPLIIAGRGPDDKKLKQMIKILKLEKYVKVNGPAFGKEKEKLMANAIFAVVPSRSEGFSLFSLEALASGLPLVTFAIPGLTWIYGNAALKEEKFNTDEYSNLLLKAVNKKLNLKMSESARILARNYNWDDVASQYELFFYDIVYFIKNYGWGFNTYKSFGFLNK